MNIRNAIFLVLLIFGIASIGTAGGGDFKKRAENLHKKILTVDSHTDSPFQLMDPGFDMSQRHNPDSAHSKLDFPRMKEGGLDAAFFAVFIAQGKRDQEANGKAISKSLVIFDSIHSMIDRNKALCGLAVTEQDALKLKKEGKRAIFIGVENGYAIGNDLSLIRKYYDLGARYITLCHTKNNDICSSSTDTSSIYGLTDFGKKVVREMNRTGMIVDVSHISDQAFYDVLKFSTAPVIASHSCARALCNNPRNLDDNMLKALAEKGGVIQMCILSDYVKKPDPFPARDSAFAALRKKYRGFADLSEDEMKKAHQDWDALDEKYPEKLATVADVVDHIDHIVRVIGVDHVGIGTDFDGGGGVTGCYDVSEMKNITIELMKRGYSDDAIAKIWGGNLMRVLNAVGRTADQFNK